MINPEMTLIDRTRPALFLEFIDPDKIISRFMGSRSHPRSVVCVCVCVCGCVWLRLIRSSWGSFTGAILDPVTLSCVVRSSDCLPCHGQWFSSVPASCFRDSWSLLFSWTLSPDTWLPIVSLRYLPQPTESSTLFPQFHQSDVFAINRSCFRNLNPPVFIYDRRIWPQYGFSGGSWFSGTVSQQQRSYGSTGGEYVEHRTSCAGVSSAGVRAHHPVATIKIIRCATHTADSPSPGNNNPQQEPRLPTPEVYAEDPNLCRAFLTKCFLFFSLQPQTFATEASKVALV